MQSLTHVTGVAIPMIEDDLNTDQMAPLQLAKGLKPDYADLLFKRRRQNPDGSLIADYVLNQPQFTAPSILVAGSNFGCGSSRESAVWCLYAVGIRCVIARSIADIFRENCLQNGVLPIELDDAAMDGLQQRVLAADGAAHFSVDLEAQTIDGPGGEAIGFDVRASDKLRLIEGLDEIGLTMKHASEIRAWEAQTLADTPWLQQARDKRA
jgi:3-isopropylmalate/(R)-2-methylmalate dehydratase small subunit